MTKDKMTSILDISDLFRYDFAKNTVSCNPTIKVDRFNCFNIQLDHGKGIMQAFCVDNDLTVAKNILNLNKCIGVNEKTKTDFVFVKDGNYIKKVKQYNSWENLPLDIAS